MTFACLQEKHFFEIFMGSLKDFDSFRVVFVLWSVSSCQASHIYIQDKQVFNVDKGIRMHLTTLKPVCKCLVRKMPKSEILKFDLFQ